MTNANGENIDHPNYDELVKFERAMFDAITDHLNRINARLDDLAARVKGLEVGP